VALEARNAHIDLEIAKGTITRYAKLDRFMIVNARPETSDGKIDKKRLRAQFGVAGSGLPWALANDGV